MMSLAQATEVLAAERGDAVTVLTMSPLGFWPEPGERDLRLLGLMGAAASIGLGIAVGRPDQEVWVIDGDGSLLMQLGVLAAIADARPANLVHVVIDNGVYAVSGAQSVPGGVDWPVLLRGAGIPDVRAATTADELRAAVARDRVPGPRAVVARCERARPEYRPGFLDFSAAAEWRRVRTALHG